MPPMYRKARPWSSIPMPPLTGLAHFIFIHKKLLISPFKIQVSSFLWILIDSCQWASIRKIEKNCTSVVAPTLYSIKIRNLTTWPLISTRFDSAEKLTFPIWCTFSWAVSQITFSRACRETREDDLAWSTRVKCRCTCTTASSLRTMKRFTGTLMERMRIEVKLYVLRGLHD